MNDSVAAIVHSPSTAQEQRNDLSATSLAEGSLNEHGKVGFGSLLVIELNAHLLPVPN